MRVAMLYPSKGTAMPFNINLRSVCTFDFNQTSKMVMLRLYSVFIRLYDDNDNESLLFVFHLKKSTKYNSLSGVKIKKME